MKTIIILLLTILAFFTSENNDTKITSKYNCEVLIKDKGRCTGSSSCSACRNCSRCGHCSNGGSCGVCAGSSSNTFYSTPSKKTKSNSNYKPAVKTEVYYKNQSITIYKEKINLRKEPSTKSAIIEILSFGDTVFFIEKNGEWSKVKVKETGTVGYLYTNLLM